MTYHKILKLSKYTTVEITIDGVTSDIRNELIGEYDKVVRKLKSNNKI